MCYIIVSVWHDPTALLIVLLFFLFLLARGSSKNPNAPSFQIRSGWNLARLYVLHVGLMKLDFRYDVTFSRRHDVKSVPDPLYIRTWHCFTDDILPSGKDVFAVAGDRVRLTCQLKADSLVNCSTPSFFRAGRQPLARWVQQRRISESAVELVIERVSALDVGRYFCYTGYDYKNTSEPTAAITVYVTSQFSCFIVISVIYAEKQFYSLICYKR